MKTSNASSKSESVSVPTGEQLRVRVAELCGWTIPEHCITKRRQRGEKRLQGACPDFGFKDDQSGELPDYPNDLNAMHEAEKILSENCVSYISELFTVLRQDGVLISSGRLTAVDCWAIRNATANQLARAFVKTMASTPTGEER